MISTTGVIILGNEYQALGLLRQLSTSGIACVLVDQDAWGPALFSRYRCPFYRSPAYSSQRFWPWLVELARRHGYLGWVLIACDDEQVRQIAEHYDEAMSLFRYAGLPWEVYCHLYDKRLTCIWAERLGINAPFTYIPARKDESLGDLLFPAIVKPAIKRKFNRYSKKKAIRVDSPTHLYDVINGDLAMVPIEELLYQELIPGDGRYQWSYAGFFVHGEPIAAFTACRRRQHPPDFGRASTYVVATHDADVERESRKVLAALDYTGLAEVEWKRDPRDGKLKFLEINARCWGWHSLASRVVGNLPKMLYDYLLSGTVGYVDPIYGSRWIKWITDVPVAVDLLHRGELNWRDYVRSLRGNLVCCDWDPADPLPFFFQIALLPSLIIKRGY
jgi:predicted ATP-grasp superfamily ATP-dependent carboligase